MQDWEGMQDPIPEYYFTENGKDCFSSGKAVQIEEHMFTDKDAPVLPGRTGKSLCLCVLSLGVTSSHKKKDPQLLPYET